MENNEKEYGKLQWLFFVIIIPMLFTGVLVLIILSVAGFDVAGKAGKTFKEIPLLTSGEGNDAAGDNSADALEKKQVKLQSENDRLSEEVSALKLDLQILENDKQKGEKEVARLKQENSSLEQLLLQKEEEKEGQSKDISKVYSKMSSKKAAEILPQLNNDEALRILNSMSDTQLAGVLGKMSTEEAAKFTALLTNSNE
ncbi:MotE family protein [Metabacillus lacus]|nr:hypothetical protein [Metabacillus lacus]